MILNSLSSYFYLSSVKILDMHQLVDFCPFLTQAIHLIQLRDSVKQYAVWIEMSKAWSLTLKSSCLCEWLNMGIQV